MAKSKRGVGELALMFGNGLDGRVMVCRNVPSGITVRGKTVHKVCSARQFSLATLKKHGMLTVDKSKKGAKRYKLGTLVPGMKKARMVSMKRITKTVKSAKVRQMNEAFRQAAKGKGKIAKGSKIRPW